MDNLDLAHVPALVADDHQVDHQVAPSARRRALEAVLEAQHVDQLRVAQCLEPVDNRRDHAKVLHDDHRTHHVEDAVGLADRGVAHRLEQRLLHDALQLLEPRRLPEHT